MADHANSVTFPKRKQRMEDRIVMYTASEIEILTAQKVLEAAGISSFIFNRKDSVYPGLIGEIELHVDKSDEAKAREVLQQQGIIEQ